MIHLDHHDLAALGGRPTPSDRAGVTSSRRTAEEQTQAFRRMGLEAFAYRRTLAAGGLEIPLFLVAARPPAPLTVKRLGPGRRDFSFGGRVYRVEREGGSRSDRIKGWWYAETPSGNDVLETRTLADMKATVRAIERARSVWADDAETYRGEAR